MSDGQPEPTRFLIPEGTHRVEEVIQKSRFITFAAHAPTAEAAQAFLNGIREEFPDATHHCWAFVAGPPGTTASIGMSDDGEPHGTAGRPMLNTLLHSDVGEIVTVCVRYFGGTKLGTGGLSRAYSGGVKLVLETLPVREKVRCLLLEMEIEYDAVDPLKRLLQVGEAEVVSEEYGAGVVIRARVPEEEAPGLEETLRGITRGGARIRRLEAEGPGTGEGPGAPTTPGS